MSSMNTIDILQTMLPAFYKKYVDDNSVLYAIIDAFSNTINYQDGTVSRIDKMIGIDTTDDVDLEHRWGGLLNCYKNPNESYDNYRTRLKLVYISLSGGTSDAIKRSVGYCIGLTDDDDISKFVKVYDGWEYDGEIVIDPQYKTNCNVICVIDISLTSLAQDMEDEIISKIDNIKAAGINVYIVFTYGALYDAMNMSISDVYIDDIMTAMNILNNPDFTTNSTFILNYLNQQIGG